MSAPKNFLWKTTGTIETKVSLSKMYPAIPKIVIREAVDTGKHTFEELKELWQEHEKKSAKNRAIGQAKSCKSMRGWCLGEKRNYRHYPL